MFSRTVVIILLATMVFLQGCSTMQGAANGFKDDWKKLTEIDEWLQEKLW